MPFPGWVHRVSVLLLVLYSAQTARADIQIDITRPDSQSHFVVGFQSALTFGRLLEAIHVPRIPAAILSAGGSLALAYAKEKYADTTFDDGDLVVGGMGITTALILLLLWPNKQNSWLSFEPEAGLLSIKSITDSGTTTPPPVSTMIHYQTTLWIQHALGLHLFSGGMDLTSSDMTKRRLLFGVGARMSVLPLPGTISGSKVPPFMVWAGVDYGYLLFASSAEGVSYEPSSYVPFYSAGLKWRPGPSQLFLATEVLAIPYGGNILLAPGLQVGLEL